jgi:aminopeptidase N
VPVEVYVFRDHHYNVDRMLEGMVDALSTFERDFGPFQHDILRIVEFPRYASFAQSFPTLVPFSESIGFIARLADPDEDIDYPFYVTAHEVAHQWWAHQVCGGNGQGATVLTETLSQYSALKVMEAEYGPDEIERFLAYESDRYFMGRSNERDKELPLMRVENQGYIHYQKGGLVVYALSERVGRERFDAAVRSFLEEWRFQGPPYPIARDFVEHLKAELPEHVTAIEETFEKIVLYDLRLKGATGQRQGSGWGLDLDVFAQKLEADGEGREAEVPFDDRVMVSVEDADGEWVDQTVRITGTGSVRVVFPGLTNPPVSVELDRRALFLDRERDDNRTSVELESDS